MAKVKVTAKFQVLDLVDRIVDGNFNARLGRLVSDEAKAMIAAGQSPVRGYGRFDGYSESYKGAIKGKSLENKSKTVRPVNLNLSGKMLENYGSKSDARSVWVGVLPGEHSELAQYHNEGTAKMPQRKLVPTNGEGWAARIMRIIKEEYGKSLVDFIRKTNSK